MDYDLWQSFECKPDTGTFRWVLVYVPEKLSGWKQQHIKDSVLEDMYSNPWLAMVDLDKSLYLNLSFSVYQVPVRWTQQRFFQRIAGISNEIMYEKVLWIMQLSSWWQIYGQRDKCSGQTVFSGQKSVFCLVEPAPIRCVTDFTTLVIFVQLFCVTCPAAEDGCVCTPCKIRGATRSNTRMPGAGWQGSFPENSCLAPKL